MVGLLLLQRSTNCTHSSCPPQWGPVSTVFWAGRPSGPAGWLAQLLLKAGDVETNPGPKHTRTQVWICDICHREITRKQTSLRCNHSEHWVHLRCAHIRVDQYTDTWICHLHRGSRLPHATYTSPHFPLASSKPLLHSPPTPPTPPHPKHQHTSNSPTSPPKMTNPSLPKPLIHSPPTPPTPPPAKQIHISHKTPSPSTTPRISITTRTSNAAERPVPVSSPSATNTQVTLNTTIATPTATALPTQTHHTDRVAPNSDKTRTIRTAHTANTTSIHKPSSNNERNLIILQVNINSINNKLEELKTLIKNTHADIITIQETKLTSKSNTPKVPTYTTVRADRPHKSGGGLITLIRDNITFTPTDIPSTINTHNIELQMVKVHLNNTKHITIANVYIPPRDSTSTHHKTADKDIQHCIQHITTIPHSVLTGDVNAHSSLWHSYTDDHRGQLIAEVISNSDHISLNTDTPTRVPNTAFQQTSSPDITTVSNTLYNRTSWQTHHALSSDHLPIMTTINIRHNFRLQTYRRTFTNYKKANWTQFTKDTELAFSQTTIPDDIHTANRIFTNIILLADKHNIPKGKMPSTSRLLPEHIVCKITQRDNIRRANPCDPALKPLNLEITSDISLHKQNLWKEHHNANWDHRHNTHTLWKTIHGLSNRAAPTPQNCTITFNKKIATSPKNIVNCFNKQFTNTVKHSTHKTNRSIDRAVHKLPKHTITLTTTQVQEAIQHSKNNNSVGPDNLSIRHLKHIGPLGLTFLTSMYTAALNKNIIPHMWKLANIIPIPKPNKDTNMGTSYRPISLLSVVAKTLEKCLLPYITANITQTPTQHGYKAQHSTVTALHTLNNTVAKGFNQMAPPARTITVALDMSKAFDTVNTHTLIGKLLQTSTPGTILKFVANYIKGRKAYTSFRNHKSIQRQVKTGVPQGGVLSPTLFNIHTADIPTPTAPVQVMMYADDITITSTHTSMSAARKYIQPYLHKVYDWTQHNNLIINPDKTTCTLFTPDPAEYNSNLGLNINNKALPMALHPKVLGLTLDPKLTYNAHIQNIATHAQKPLQVIKALTGTTWGKQKETLVATYKAVMRPTLEYASSIWSPMASPTSINKLQVMQNAALRACTGCTHDTNIQHLHDETNILPIQKHLQLHASQIRQKAQYPSHPLYKYTTHNNSQRLMKPTTFNNSRYTTNIPTDPCTVTTADIKANMRDIHTTIVSQHLAARDNNKILRTHPPQVSSTEENLPRHTRRTLAQLRTNKSPFLLSYLHKIDASTHPSPLCPLCSTHEHTTQHLFSCPQIPTTLSALDLWRDPSGVAALLDDWREKLAANPHQTTEADSPQ